MQPFQWFLYVSLALVVSIAWTGNCGSHEGAAVQFVRELGGKIVRRGDVTDGPVIGVDLAGTAVDGTQLGELHSLKRLQTLNLRGTITGIAPNSKVNSIPVRSDDLRQLSQFPELRSLDIGYTLVDGTGLSHLSQAANLEVLNLEGLSIDGNSLEALRGCSNLRELSLTVVPGLELKTLQDLPCLQTLRIFGTGFEFKLDPALKSQLLLLKDVTGLQTLDIGVCDDVLHALREFQLLHKHVCASSLNGKRPSRPDEVTAFDLSRFTHPIDGPMSGRLMYVTDACLAALHDFKALQVVDLRDTLVTDTGLSQLKVFRGLHTVRLRCQTLPIPEFTEQFPSFTDAGLRSLAEIPTLRSLDIAGANITDAGLEALGKLTKLQSLNLDATGSRTMPGGVENLSALTELQYLGLAGNRRISLTSLLKLKGLSHLRVLDLNSSSVTDAGLAIVKHFPELRVLNLGYTNVTGAGLESLAGLSHLKSLDLRQCEVQGAALKPLRSCRSLIHLRLDPRDLTDSTLGSLREMELLTALNTDWTSDEFSLNDDRPLPDRTVGLRRLDLGGSKVTDAGLAELRDLNELEVVGLRGLKLNGTGLKELVGLKRLHTVDVDVTDPVIKTLRDVDRLHLLSPALNQYLGRATSAAEVMTFDILATQQFINSTLTGAGLRDLKPLVNVRTLRFVQYEHQILDEHLVALGEVGLLHALPQALAQDGGRPTGPDDVVRLDLHDTRLSDAGLKSLNVFKNLQVLNIAGTQVYDLMPLATLKKLESLDVRQTVDGSGKPRRVKGIIPLSDTLPRLRIKS